MAKVNHQQLVKKLLDAKAVDFAAIGKVVAELGPSLALANADAATAAAAADVVDGDYFCGTIRHFVNVLIVNPPPVVINPPPPKAE
jgi:hypothetical protein